MIVWYTRLPKLLITQATGYRFRGLLEPYKLRKRKLVGAVLPYLAALAPRDWKITLVDDATEQIDFNADVDVVAITIRTVTSLRGYEIAAKFRSRGIPVIIGGPHATFYADEVAEHADEDHDDGERDQDPVPNRRVENQLLRHRRWEGSALAARRPAASG